MSTNAELYEQDFYAWTQEQAALLEGRQFDALDIPNLVEEITSLGKSEQRELVHRLEPLLEPLVKLTIAAEHLPHDLQRAGRLWRITVKTQRVKVAQVLRDNPSLRPTVSQAVADAYAVARLAAAAALDLDEDTVPETCSWTPEQVLAADFWPDGAPTR
jgi:uncharacterized protein DUF29